MFKKTILEKNIFTNLFGKHDANFLYRVKLKDIKISERFIDHPPSKMKLNNKLDFYNKTGKFQSTIVLDNDFRLVDGYTTYIICKMKNIDYVDVLFK